MTDTAAGHVASAKDASDHTEGMSYLETLPSRLVTLYIPLGIILVILLFPFYWMALTSIKPDAQLIDMETYNPFWVVHPTLKHIQKLLFETQYPRWLWNTMYVATGATVLSIAASVLAAYSIVRLQFKGAAVVGAAIFFAYLVPPADPHQDHPAAGRARTDLGLHLFLHAVLERVHLCTDPAVVDAEQDCAGGDRQRVRRRRYLSLGRADGRRLRRLAAAGDSLCVFRRTLCVGDDRCCKRVEVSAAVEGRETARPNNKA